MLLYMYMYIFHVLTPITNRKPTTKTVKFVTLIPDSDEPSHHQSDSVKEGALNHEVERQQENHKTVKPKGERGIEQLVGEGARDLSAT